MAEKEIQICAPEVSIPEIRNKVSLKGNGNNSKSCLALNHAELLMATLL
jgi:hypothetical protein